MVSMPPWGRAGVGEDVGEGKTSTGKSGAAIVCEVGVGQPVCQSDGDEVGRRCSAEFGNWPAYTEMVCHRYRAAAKDAAESNSSIVRHSSSFQ